MASASDDRLLEELRRNEQRLKEAQRVARIGSWEWDVRNDRIEWSDELYRVYGLKPQEFQATFEDYISRIHPEDREMVQAIIQSTMETKKEFTFDHRALQPDGTTFWMHSQGAVDVDDEGNVLRMHGTGQDITDRKMAETQFESLLESAPDGMFLVGPDGVIVLVNAQAVKLFGYPREELVGQPIEKLVPTRHRGVHAGHRKKYVESPTTRPMGMGLELSALRKDGSEFPVEISLSPIDGTKQGNVVAVVRDVTEKKQMAEADRLAFSRGMEIAKLKEIDQFKTRLLNTAAHELNTPITPLRLQLHLLQANSDRLDDSQKKAVDILDRNVRRLQNLVSDFLDVARLQSGRLRMDAAAIDLTEVVDEAVQTFEATAEQQDIQITIESEGAFDTWADRNRISQIVYNFLSNAIKFSSEGSTVRVIIHRSGDHERVEVHDEGIGMEPDQIDQLFQPFSQVHERVQGTPAGTGLGLFICKGIAEEHGGRIGVTSEGLGHGSMFWFEIPVRTEDDWIEYQKQSDQDEEE